MLFFLISSLHVCWQEMAFVFLLAGLVICDAARREYLENEKSDAYMEDRYVSEKLEIDASMEQQTDAFPSLHRAKHGLVSLVFPSQCPEYPSHHRSHVSTFSSFLRRVKSKCAYL